MATIYTIVALPDRALPEHMLARARLLCREELLRAGVANEASITFKPIVRRYHEESETFYQELCAIGEAA